MTKYHLEVEEGVCDNKKLGNVTSVSFPAKISVTTSLSNQIESIKFHAYYDSPIPSGVLPKKLKHLDLGWYYNQEISDEILPESLEVLIFGHWFHQPLWLKPRNHMDCLFYFYFFLSYIS